MMERIAKNKSVPVKNAERIISEYMFKTPLELDIELIANAEGIIVEEAEIDTILGKITYNTDFGVIKINRMIKEEGQKRFTIAHELGHFFNEFDIRTNSLFRQIDKAIWFNSGKKYEDDANEFAAELLMHRPWFSKFIQNKKINFELLKEISDHFRVSLSAAGYRYVDVGKYPCALICSTSSRVKWKVISDYFPFHYIRYDSPVPANSAVSDFFEGRQMQTGEDLIEARDWFPEDRSIKPGIYLYEQNAAMPAYNSVLTLLWET